MIFELKVTLEETGYPIERVVHVDERTSLRQMHHIMQAVFDWYGVRPHHFITEQEERAIDQIEDEQTIRLYQCFHKTGDTIVYRYGVDRRWVHTLQLVHILEAEPEVLYPKVISASYYSPFENEELEAYQERMRADAMENGELLEAVNESLARSLPIISIESSPKSPKNFEDVLKLAKTFYTERPWETIEDSQPFIVLDPETNQRLFCSINGADGENAGLTVYLGDESFSHLLESSLLYEESGDEIAVAKALSLINALGLIYKEESELDREDSYLLNTYSVSFENPDVLPVFSSISPENSVARQLNSEEVRLMKLALEQALEVLSQVRAGLELPSIPETNVLLARVYSEEFNQFINNEVKIIPQR